MNMAILHLVARGVRRGLLFESKPDFKRFLGFLERFCGELGVRVVAYCLMSNHYHLLVQCPRDVVSEFLKRLNGTYALAYNLATERCGHVFEKRAKAFDRWGTALLPFVATYIFLNPVKAGLASIPQRYPHSSCAATLRLKAKPEWIDDGSLFECFSPDPETGARRFALYLADHVNIVALMKEAAQRWSALHPHSGKARNKLLLVEYAAFTAAAVDRSPILHELDERLHINEIDFKILAMREIAGASENVIGAVLNMTRQAVHDRRAKLARKFKAYPGLKEDLETMLKGVLLSCPEKLCV